MRRARLLLLLTVPLLGAAPAAAAPKASDFAVRLPTDAAAHAASAERVLTIRPRRKFDVFGLRWRTAARGVHLHVRVAEPGGRWKRWVEVDAAHSAHGSDPVWAGGADRAQVRLPARLRGVSVHFVRVTGEPRRPRVVARAAADQPAFIPRSQWGADTECTPRDTPSMGTVQMAFVHHTVSANDYGPQDSAAMVLGICRFHRNTNGWDDVGYNFLVDKYGQLFEGRAGGVDQPVVGAQAQGWNSVSTGIANLGTYQDVPVSDQALETMARLIAWKLPLHGTPVTGEVTVESQGGDTNRYAKGELHTFQRISGHTDGDNTQCPGAQLYAQLPRLREMADARAPDVIPAAAPLVPAQPARITLAAVRRRLAYPEPARLSGSVADAAGAPAANVRLRIQVLTAKGFRAVGQAVSGADGAFTAELPTSRNRVVRALVGKVASNTIPVTVTPSLLVSAPAPRVRAGRRAVLAGSLRPRKGVVSVEAARQVGATSYRRAAVVRATAKSGRFRAVIRLVTPGLYRLRVRFAGDRRNEPAQADFYVRAVRPGASLTGGATGAQPAR